LSGVSNSAVAFSRRLDGALSMSKSEPQYMQRKDCVVMMERVAVTPWLNGKRRVARECARAPELIIGVPLQSGQWAERRLKNAINHVTMVNEMPPMKMSRASRLGSVKIRTNEVSVTTMPR
jgi:hypothetical protein